MGWRFFFIEFLHVSGVWAALRDRCRLQRTSPNAPDHASVVGRMVLAVLSGGNRYRHVDGVRSDVVAGGASGSVNFGLGSPMVTVYGKQSGSAVGYNSTKPGRPSYRYHMSLIGGLLLPLNGDVRPGNESLGVYSAWTLWRLLDQRLPAEAQPWGICSDIFYGNETVISGCESRRRDYLFKVKKRGKIKALIHEFDNGDHVWSHAGQGRQGREVCAQWLGWSAERRLVILRRHHTGKDKKASLIS